MWRNSLHERVLEESPAFSSLMPQAATPACPKRLFPASGREVSPLSVAVSSGLTGPGVSPVSLPKALEL